MYLRIFSIGLAGAALTACGSEIETPEPQGDGIECAIGPGTEMANVCTLEVISTDEFVVHHPDGGFRRFIIGDDNAFMPADGADEFEVVAPNAPDQNAQVYMIGDDRYALPQSALPIGGND